jgi:hypothetical protein
LFLIYFFMFSLICLISSSCCNFHLLGIRR